MTKPGLFFKKPGFSFGPSPRLKLVLQTGYL